MTDTLGPLALIGVGLAFAAASWTGLDLGTLRRLGPGALPLGLGIVLAMLGAVALTQGLLKGGDRVPRPDLRALAAVGAAIAAFAFLAERLGLLPAVFASVLAMTSVMGALRWPQRLALALGVSAGIWGIFLLGLRLPVQAFGAG